MEWDTTAGQTNVRTRNSKRACNVGSVKKSNNNKTVVFEIWSSMNTLNNFVPMDIFYYFFFFWGGGRLLQQLALMF